MAATVNGSAAAPQLAGERGGVRRRDPRQQDRELVAAQPRQRDAAAPRRQQVRGQPVGDRPQQPVAGAVTERVVDLLEPVEVDEQERSRAAPAVDAVEQLADDPAVGQPGERVGARLLPRVGQGDTSRTASALRRQAAASAATASTVLTAGIGTTAPIPRSATATTANTVGMRNDRVSVTAAAGEPRPLAASPSRQSAVAHMASTALPGR